MDKLSTYGIPRGVHLYYGLSADAGSMWYTMHQDSRPQADLKKFGPNQPKIHNLLDSPTKNGYVFLALFSLSQGVSIVSKMEKKRNEITKSWLKFPIMDFPLATSNKVYTDVQNVHAEKSRVDIKLNPRF